MDPVRLVALESVQCAEDARWLFESTLRNSLGTVVLRAQNAKYSRVG